MDIIEFVKQLKNIPVSSEYHAHRYDTDDEHVLHMWDNKENSFDIRISKNLEITELDGVDEVGGAGNVDRVGRDTGGGTNRIRMGFPECIEIECESSELKFDELEKKTLGLLKIAKSHVMKSDAYEHETA